MGNLAFVAHENHNYVLERQILNINGRAETVKYITNMVIHSRSIKYIRGLGIKSKQLFLLARLIVMKKHGNKYTSGSGWGLGALGCINNGTFKTLQTEFSKLQHPPLNYQTTNVHRHQSILRYEYIEMSIFKHQSED